MAGKKLNIYDLRYRLNKLKCCFAKKTAALVDKQKYGKPCEEEKCNVQLLGAYIEMVECIQPVGCTDCTQDWIDGGSLIWDENTVYTKDQIVKVWPRGFSSGSDFVLMRWVNQLPSSSFPNNAAGEGGVICWEDGGLLQTGHVSPCYNKIDIHHWSVCSNEEIAWQAQGSMVWDPTIVYQYGSIVKFSGGGVGLDQSGQGQYYISNIKNNFTNAQNLGFHESGDWNLLDCFEDII
tara:strand:- start:48441 stop:49145 length:705 start_codon:yes stop_codon:yes gene_type:complete